MNQKQKQIHYLSIVGTPAAQATVQYKKTIDLSGWTEKLDKRGQKIPCVLHGSPHRFHNLVSKRQQPRNIDEI